AALGSAVFNRPRDFLANYRSHGGSKEPEIHHGDGHLVAVKNSVACDDSVEKPRALMVFFEPIRIASHSLKAQDVDRFQVGICFYKSVRVEQILNPLLGRLRKVIV